MCVFILRFGYRFCRRVLSVKGVISYVGRTYDGSRLGFRIDFETEEENTVLCGIIPVTERGIVVEERVAVAASSIFAAGG